MKVTIIHKPDCPLCERAIREFAGDGHEIELHERILDVPEPERRRDMMADICVKGGDIDAYPQVFVEDEYTDWKPKKGE